VPSNILLSRCRPSLYLPGFVILWGTVSASAAAANSYSHLVVCRFFLGVTEAPFFPGILFFLSSWYTKRELAVGPSQELTDPSSVPRSCTLARTCLARSPA
jgi:MFS family permease